MNSIAAPVAWPRSRVDDATASPTWQLARAVTLDAGGRRQPALRWVLPRNCALTPRQTLLAFALLALPVVLVGVGFLWAGFAVVLVFAGLEIAALAVALFAYARHAADRETVTLTNRSMTVETDIGGRHRSLDLDAQWARVATPRGDGALVEVAAGPARLRVGRFLRPEFRPLLARELRVALQRARQSNVDSET